MTISKSLRFEILRRDGFACTYCGAMPPTAILHIDHVKPAALGGQESPENLVTACADCNMGKGSTPPDAEVVADAEADATRWAAAVRAAGQEMVAEIEDAEWFPEFWWKVCGGYVPISHNATHTVALLQQRGLPLKVIKEMVYVAADAPYVATGNRFAYFVGCCNKRLEKLQWRAAQIIEAGDAGGDDA